MRWSFALFAALVAVGAAVGFGSALAYVRSWPPGGSFAVIGDAFVCLVLGGLLGAGAGALVACWAVGLLSSGPTRNGDLTPGQWPPQGRAGLPAPAQGIVGRPPDSRKGPASDTRIVPGWHRDGATEKDALG